MVRFILAKWIDSKGELHSGVYPYNKKKELLKILKRRKNKGDIKSYSIKQTKHFV